MNDVFYVQIIQEMQVFDLNICDLTTIYCHCLQTFFMIIPKMFSKEYLNLYVVVTTLGCQTNMSHLLNLDLKCS